MRWIKRHGLFKTKRRWVKPNKVILHHTAGGTLRGAVDTLKKRGLGYHYMISKAGDIYEYVPADRWTAHAYKNNRGTVGVSYVCGGKYGHVNEKQLESSIQLLKVLKTDYPTITTVTSHKRVDPRGWKIDPRFKGEPANGIDWEVDEIYMQLIATHTDLNLEDRRK